MITRPLRGGNAVRKCKGELAFRPVGMCFSHVTKCYPVLLKSKKLPSLFLSRFPAQSRAVRGAGKSPNPVRTRDPHRWSFPAPRFTLTRRASNGGLGAPNVRRRQSSLARRVSMMTSSATVVIGDAPARNLRGSKSRPNLLCVNPASRFWVLDSDFVSSRSFLTSIPRCQVPQQVPFSPERLHSLAFVS